MTAANGRLANKWFMLAEEVWAECEDEEEEGENWCEDDVVTSLCDVTDVLLDDVPLWVISFYHVCKPVF